MSQRKQKSMGFFKSTAIGGLLFLLPLIITGWLLSQVYAVVVQVYDVVHSFLPLRGPAGIMLLFLLSLVVLILLCFVAGLFAQRAIAGRLSTTFERLLITLFPKYAIYKDVIAGSVGSAITPSLSPVVIRMADCQRIGFESGRGPAGAIVYLPGAPDPWSGSLAIVEADRVSPLNVTLKEATEICERLGRDSVEAFQSLRSG